MKRSAFLGSGGLDIPASKEARMNTAMTNYG
jgi:hypothetical protein